MQQTMMKKESLSEKKHKKTIDYKKNLEICFFVNGKPISKSATIYEIFEKYLNNSINFSVNFE